jgi:Nif-specific regulatory protein
MIKTNCDECSLHLHLERHERELNALNEIGYILSKQSGQREMLIQVLDVLEEQLGMMRGTVMLLSLDGSELLFEAAKNAQFYEQLPVRYQRGEGVIGKVLQTGKPAVIPKIADEPRFQSRIHKREKESHHHLSFICVPIQMGNEVVGTLSIDLPIESESELEESRRVLTIVASLIAFDVKSRRIMQIQRQTLESENLRLRSALGEQFRPEMIIGNSNAMRGVYQKIHQVAESDTTVLIRGESGTGKELVASAIHYSSLRSAKPFIKVNCAALSENLIESELFGHEKGAYTGAQFARTGRLEEADGGTLFLDEIGDFSPSIQVKLLRVLQEKEFERVGSNKTLTADVRILTATNCDLEEAVKNGKFRQDLFYRINVFPVCLPPLRERKDDILQLVDSFIQKYNKRMKKEVKRISTSAIDMMTAYHWPGNVRELENCIEYAMLLAVDNVIQGHHLPPSLQMPESKGVRPIGSLKSQVEQLERDLIMDSLKRNNGNITAASRELCITSRMVRYKIEKMGIDYQRLFKKKKIPTVK